ncbi:hypothetical protein LSH36_251g08011 [Paralvinella palmiformis]|uniref:Uncharacterized protein n=1 Tax=Paralvinella palmiformis TaxID=53620 RepID=A0AAD9JN24_9ANNE|nr:hypothetical protein LSH36_251g08011 [Paralvinella palmiformis]
MEMQPKHPLVLCLFVNTVFLLLPPVFLSCDFPKFLQSRRDGPRREWHVQQVEYHRGREHRYIHVVTFAGSTMKARVNGNKHADHVHHSPKSYTRRCVLEIEPGQFLVTHNVIGGSTQLYSCMEFIKRSDNVFQVKQSELSPVQDPRLCADRLMTVSNWPFVNKAGLMTSSEPCPLEGGYNARFFDKKRHVGYCDVYEGETRIESECMKGEGIFFRFRYDECVPDDLPMGTEQQLFCAASWQDDEFVYSILRHSTKDHQWCLRYPRKPGPKFNAILFRDLVCDSSYHPNDTSEYYTISMFRDAAHSFSDLCRDDYEGCSYWSTPCDDPGSTSFVTCARTCKLCNGTRPAPCSLPLELRGEWLETNRLGHDIVDIRKNGFSKYQYDRFQCVRWHDDDDDDDAPEEDHDPDFVEEMMVSTFDNGCRPRYSCVQFKKRSPSVLHYKLSLAKVWPFYDTDWRRIDCSSFRYKDEAEPLGDVHRSRHFKALISMDAITNVNCDIGEPVEFTTTGGDAVSCHGLLTEDNDSVYRHKHLQLLLYDCPARRAQQTFACLYSSRHGYLSKHIIITEAIDDTNEYQCWLFPVSPDRTFYLIPMRHCNEGAAARILDGSLEPLSTFRISSRTTTTTMKTTTTTTITDTSSSTSLSPTPNIVVEHIVSVPPSARDQIDYDYDYSRLSDFLIRMNDMSPVRSAPKSTKTANSHVTHQSPDKYSHLSNEASDPEEGRLVSDESRSGTFETAQSPMATLNKRHEAKTSRYGNGVINGYTVNVGLLLAAAIFVLIH